MNTDPGDIKQDLITEELEDARFYRIKKYKHQLEGVSIVIFAFAALGLLSYCFFLMRSNFEFDVMDLAINICAIAFYCCLAIYIKQKPFTALIAVLATIIVFSLINMSPSPLNLIVRVSLIVFISLKLDIAQKVQGYEKKSVS